MAKPGSVTRRRTARSCPWPGGTIPRRDHSSSRTAIIVPLVTRISTTAMNTAGTSHWLPRSSKATSAHNTPTGIADAISKPLRTYRRSLLDGDVDVEPALNLLGFFFHIRNHHTSSSCPSAARIVEMPASMIRPGRGAVWCMSIQPNSLAKATGHHPCDAPLSIVDQADKGASIAVLECRLRPELSHLLRPNHGRHGPRGVCFNWRH